MAVPVGLFRTAKHLGQISIAQARRRTRERIQEERRADRRVLADREVDDARDLALQLTVGEVQTCIGDANVDRVRAQRRLPRLGRVDAEQAPHQAREAEGRIARYCPLGCRGLTDPVRGCLVDRRPRAYGGAVEQIGLSAGPNQRLDMVFGDGLGSSRRFDTTLQTWCTRGDQHAARTDVFGDRATCPLDFTTQRVVLGIASGNDDDTLSFAASLRPLAGGRRCRQ